MAVESFFLMGFRALSDIIKELFPKENNPIGKIAKKMEETNMQGDTFLKILEGALIRYKNIAFEDKELRFHLIKQLEPAFGHKVILKMEPLKPIAIAMNRVDKIFSAQWASPKDLSEFPGIVFPFEDFRQFLVEDKDVLKMITLDKIALEKFDELNETIVRALLGFTSAYYLRKEFRERVKAEFKSCTQQFMKE